jgi:hypothetical protein
VLNLKIEDFVFKKKEMLSDSLLIIFISLFTALLSEGLSWLLIYRTDKYKRLQSEVEKQSKKCMID